MANEFLVKIHKHLKQQIEQSRKACEQARVDKNDSRLAFHEGKLDELRGLKTYISDAFNLKTQRYD